VYGIVKLYGYVLVIFHDTLSPYKGNCTLRLKILHMTVTSLIAVVAPRASEIFKNGLFLKEEKICKMVYYTLYLSEANRQK